MYVCMYVFSGWWGSETVVIKTSEDTSKMKKRENKDRLLAV